MHISHTLTPAGDVAIYSDLKRIGTVIRVHDGYSFVRSGKAAEDHGWVYDTFDELLRELSPLIVGGKRRELKTNGEEE